MQHNKCDVIVTYCWNRVGYNILRSLAAKGLKVYTADTSKYNICSASKYCSGSFTYRDPFTKEKEFIEDITGKVKELQPKVLLPIHDEAIIIARHKDKFPKDVIIPVESEEKLLLLSNKIQSSIIAKKVGVPVPKIFKDINEVKQFPVVFKTAIGNSAKGVFFPENTKELIALSERYKNSETFIQAKASGTDYSVDCIKYGDFFFASVYKALVTKTVGGGTTTQRIMVAQPLLIDYAKRILDEVDYKGVCGIDFKVDEQEGEIAFIEVNARFTGGIATPIFAGFDIPYIHYCLVTNAPFDRNINIRLGTKTKWILGDFITLVGRMFVLKFNRREIKQIFSFSFDAFDDYRKDDKKSIFGEMSYYLHKLVTNRKLNP